MEVALAMEEGFEGSGFIQRSLEEHLSAINENTIEIQALFDYLRQLELKVDKLSQRLDGMQLSRGAGEHPISPLNQIEKNVFLVLYTEEMPLTFQEIALRTGLPPSLIPECISSLVNKGIPLHRSFCNNLLFLKLEPDFKERQAKENLINLSLQSFM